MGKQKKNHFGSERILVEWRNWLQLVIFFPFVSQQTSRVILALVAMLDMEFDQLDIKTTFLNGNLEEEIYMQQSQVFMEQEKRT